ncbi:phage tail protein [Cryptosporangium minutisporangium]|uniref:Phage tail protein n=1 Tax=Cryptosporangium minutisporangium TaxID=113569 RepID=A0ABP6T1V2_9ACTN
MPRFEESDRRDPFRSFNFHIVLGGVEVAACRKMSALDVTVNSVKFRAGNSKSTVAEMLPTLVEYEPVTLEAGVTNDRAFEEWANQLVHHEDRPGRTAEPNFRREVEIHVYDIDNTTLVRKYVLHRAWVSKYTAMSELAGDSQEVLVETLQITFEGFERIEVS